MHLFRFLQDRSGTGQVLQGDAGGVKDGDLFIVGTAGNGPGNDGADFTAPLLQQAALTAVSHSPTLKHWP